MRVWWGGENAWKAGDWAHASSFLQTHRMRSAQPSTSLFIPAHAGNTDCYLHRMGAPEAHPRAYGEYLNLAGQGFSLSGSSPCIRGIPGCVGVLEVFTRLIPVHTGNTPRTSFLPWLLTAHPRAYGEYELIIGDFEGEPGSSPCIRGILHLTRGFSLRLRLIPVHTGNTLHL